MQGLPSGWIPARLVPAVMVAAAVLAAGEATPGQGTAQAAANPIQHVIVIYQENHSFDEVLGALCVQDKRCDGSLTATLLDGSKQPLTKSPDAVPIVNHDSNSVRLAIDGGKMDGWQQLGGCRKRSGYKCLTYYDPSQIPNLAALARKFAISDRTFQRARVPSFGAHIELVATTLDGFVGSAPNPVSGITAHRGWGCDSNKFATWKDPTGSAAGVSQVPACVPDYNNPLPTLTSDRKASDGGAIVHSPVPHVPTLMDRLDKAGVSWKLYTSLKSSRSTAYVWSICPVFADCLYTAQSSNMEAPSQVVTDAQNGTLPQFSVVLPTGPSGATSQHNGTSMLKGDNWIGSVLSAVMSGPEWGSTAVFITYDDCGCFYDHVPPPRAALGIRNPMVIVSPYARPGYTDSTVASTASMLAFTEQTFGLNPLTKADANAYNYLNAFDFSQTPLSPLTMTRSKIPAATKTFIRRHPPNPDDPT